MIEAPRKASPAPAKPPISAWDDDVGSLSHHVIRSQTIAPPRPARITHANSGSPESIWMILEMVSATFVLKMNMATKLKKAAHATAYLGERTLVDTTVAMELAESWNPLMTSKRRATPIVR